MRKPTITLAPKHYDNLRDYVNAKGSTSFGDSYNAPLPIENRLLKESPNKDPLFVVVHRNFVRFGKEYVKHGDLYVKPFDNISEDTSEVPIRRGIPNSESRGSDVSFMLFYGIMELADTNHG